MRHPVRDWVTSKSIKALLRGWDQGAAPATAAAMQHAWSWFRRRRLALRPTLPWAKTLRALGKDVRQATLGRRELPGCQGLACALAFRPWLSVSRLLDALHLCVCRPRGRQEGQLCAQGGQGRRCIDVAAQRAGTEGVARVLPPVRKEALPV